MSVFDHFVGLALKGLTYRSGKSLLKTKVTLYYTFFFSDKMLLLGKSYYVDATSSVSQIINTRLSKHKRRP